MNIDWTTQLLDQLGFQWDTALRPRLDTITDEAFLWEPVAGMWSVRRRAAARSSHPQGAGDVVVDWTWPPPDPPPMTTIAWRLAHLARVFGERAANHFGDGGVTPATIDWPPTAAAMIALIDRYHDQWVAGVRALDDAGLAAPCGPAEGPYAEHPMSALVLHIHREVLHHGAEVALMMDLFANRATLGGDR
jgi:hypothetical protein